MTFEEWAESNDYYPNQFRERLEAGEKGNKLNPWLAANLAYKAGINEGKRLASERIAKLINDV